MKVLYLCDGEVPGCMKKHCYKRTKDEECCRHTKDINHAINFKKERPHGAYMEEP